MKQPVPDPHDQPTVNVDDIYENEWLPISRAGLYEQVRNGTIPSIKLGRRIVVPTAALRRMLGLDSDVAS